MTTRATIMLAEFLNPNNYDNGSALKELLEAQGQCNWIMALSVGCLLFIAFSSRFKQ